MRNICQFSSPKMKPPMPHLKFKFCSSEADAIQPGAAFCGSEDGVEQQPNMTGQKNEDCFLRNDSTGDIEV